MKAIKKTKISNIPKTSGAVVDSLESNVDKTTNAPSIRAVLQKIQEVASNILHAITADKLKTARKIKLTGAVSGEASFDGSRDVTISTTQANIAVLEGELPQDDKSEEVSTSYPEGFNKTNCIVISAEGIRATSDSSELYAFGTMYDSRSYVRGGIPLSVIRRNSDIVICAKNIILTDGNQVFARPLAENAGFKYRVVLMKIN